VKVERKRLSRGKQWQLKIKIDNEMNNLLQIQ
jgi:hypothetical protein